MYGFVWRHLPGNNWLRTAQSLVLVLGIVALLLFVIFPAVEPLLPFNNVTVKK
jgi:hypothetical protein